jgi:hypothetical protein
MTCPETAISSNGRRGIGVMQAYCGLDYPFVPPLSADGDNDIRYLVADFYLAYDDPGEYDTGSAKTAFPLRIKYLYGVGCVDNEPDPSFPEPSHAADIVIVDANDNVVFDSTASGTAFHTAAWGADYVIYAWQAADGAVCRLLAYTTWSATDDDTKDFSKYLMPPRAVLDARAVYKLPRRLKRISVEDANVTTVAPAGDIVLQNGYNTTLVTGDTTAVDFRTVTPITLSAVAGSGAGRYPCGTPDSSPKYITKINGVRPTAAGNLVLGGSGCLWARRPVDYTDGVPAPSTTAQQQMGADCKPCCACEDYAATALYMNSVRNRYKLIGQRAEHVRSLHEENVARWNSHRACSIQSPLRLLLVPQPCPTLDVVLMLCNPCTQCIPVSTLTVAFTSDEPGLTADVVCGYTALFASGVNGRPVPINSPEALTYSVNFPQITAGDSAYVKFRLKFSNRAQYSITGVLTGTAGSSPILTNCGGEGAAEAVAQASQALACTAAGTTDTPC